jgi:hypothetical protein
MRKLTMASLMVATASLILCGGPVAVAQNSMRNGNSATSGVSQPQPNAGGLPEAPVGHRQPRVGDVPSEKGVGNVDAEDAALDRKIKSICRGC